MLGVRFFTSVLILSFVAITALAAQDEEENPLVADTFTKKKKTAYFSNYQTVAINHLEAGALEFDVGAAFLHQKVGAESTSASPTVFTFDSNGNKMLLAVGGKYGLTDYLGLGADLTYASGKSESTTITSGTPSDSEDNVRGIETLKLKAQYVLALASFGYAADVTFVPSIGKASSNAGTDESNAYREQSTLGIQNYIVFTSPGVKWGGILGFDYAFNGEVETVAANGTATTKEVSGGNLLSVGGFAEFTNFFNSNFQINYLKTNSKTTTTASGVSTDSPELDYLYFSTSMKFNFARNVAFLPQFQYATIINKDADPNFSYTRVDLFALTGTIRFLF